MKKCLRMKIKGEHMAKTPTRIHIYMGGFYPLWEGGSLCKNAKKEGGWSDAYMSESQGLYQKLPRCKGCTSELERRNKLREQRYVDENVDKASEVKAKPKKLGIYAKRMPVRARDDSPLYLRTYLNLGI